MQSEHSRTEAQATAPPITRSVEVALPRHDAFDLFTNRMSTWWPLHTHSIAADTYEGRLTATSVTVEPSVGGRVTEHMSDGSSAPWGELLVWEPPSRFVMTWKPTLAEGPSTELEVRFVDISDGRTRVELEHRGWERLGARAAEKSADYSAGWARLLDMYAGAASR